MNNSNNQRTVMRAETRLLIICVVLLSLASGVQSQIAGQVHLSFGEKPFEYVATWSTPLPVQFSRARYGVSDNYPANAVEVSGWQSKFVDGGELANTQYIHRVSFAASPSVNKATLYYYQVWNDTDWSTLFSFRVPAVTSASRSWYSYFLRGSSIKDASASWYPKVTIFGDFGLSNPQIFPALLQDLATRETDFMVHNGDFAYDMYDDNGTNGDNWLNYVQPVYANIPVMTSVGNHEEKYNFSHYRARFTMPMFNQSENLFFSFNAGNTHWISFSSEAYFEYGSVDLIQKQLDFIEKDLIAANKERHIRPWIFAYAHRPMYCSDSDDDDCLFNRNEWKAELENLFYKYGVDIVFEAHQHTYERLWPTMNGRVLNSSTPGEPYRNPLAPVHIVTGAAGCPEDLQKFDKGPLGDWSAVRIADYGYGKLTILNDTHLTFDQVDKYRNVVDSILLIREQHVGYNQL